MANYHTNDDGLVQHYGTIDTINKSRRPSTGGVLQTLVLDIVGTELGDTPTTTGPPS